MRRRSEMLRISLLLVAFKILYVFSILVATHLWPVKQDANIFHSKRQQWTTEGRLTDESHFTSWDAEHYLHLSECGYESGAASCAFYPLWPLAIRAGSVLTKHNRVISGVILANLFSLIGFLLFFDVVSDYFPKDVAVWSLTFLISYPGALFFQFVYSESLFFLLLMLLWMGLERNYYLPAIVGAFLLPLTRGIGIFCIFPIFVHLIITSPVFESARRSHRRWTMFVCRMLKRRNSSVQIAPQRSSHMSQAKNAALLLAPISGWAVYFILMSRWTGDAFEGFSAQHHWGVQSVGNLFDLPKFIIGLFNPTAFHQFSGSLLDRIVFLCVFYSLFTIWRLDTTWFVWAIVLGIVPAMTGTFVSFTRFASVVFPFAIALSVFCNERRRKLARIAVIVVYGVLHVLLLWRFVNYRWAG